MKISEIVAQLVQMQMKHGDLEVVLISQHNGPQKSRGVEVMYVEDISQHYLEEIDYYNVEDGHAEVIVAYT